MCLFTFLFRTQVVAWYEDAAQRAYDAITVALQRHSEEEQEAHDLLGTRYVFDVPVSAEKVVYVPSIAR